MRVLITAASKHGATQEIAERIGAAMRAEGVDADVRPAGAAGDLDGYDAVVLGSGVYAGRWLGDARKFVDAHEQQLRELPLWLFSSGPLGEEELEPAGDPVEVAALRERLEPRGHVVFAGRLDRSRLGLAERALVRAVHAPYGDFRDPEAIEAWAREIVTA